jgi:hypothetical protein
MEAKTEKKMTVKLAMLHSATMLPGGATEATLSETKTPGIKMLWIKGEGLLLTLRNQECFIPSAAVKVVHFS